MYQCIQGVAAACLQWLRSGIYLRSSRLQYGQRRLDIFIYQEPRHQPDSVVSLFNGSFVGNSLSDCRALRYSVSKGVQTDEKKSLNNDEHHPAPLWRFFSGYFGAV